MGFIVAGIAGVISFLKFFLVKYVGHTLIISAQFTITASTIAFVLGFYLFVVTSLISIYNMGIDIVSLLSTNQDSSLSCVYYMLNCVGITPALENGFTLFYGALSTIMIFHLTRFTFSSLKVIGNEVFKLGLLLGQALK